MNITHQVTGRLGTHNRVINVFEKPAHVRGSAECWGVRKLKGPKIKKKLLVLGSGRSGTTFTAKALRVAAGLDVKHEKVGEHGTVSHYFVVDSDWYPMAPWKGWVEKGKMHVGERRSDFDFEHVVHIVRDPCKVIPSMTKIFDSVTWYFYVYNGLVPAGIKNPVLRAMHLWLNHNRKAAEQAHFSFQLERYQHAWPVLMDLLGIDAPYPAHLKPSNRSSGFKKAEPLSYKELAAVDKKLAAEIRELAYSFGYRS